MGLVIAWVTDMPRPVPSMCASTAFAVRKKRSNRCSMSFSGTPMPLSATIRAADVSASTLTSMRPPTGVNVIAFERRLSTAWPRRVESPSMKPSSVRPRQRSMERSRAAGAIARTCSETRTARSMRTTCSASAPASILATSSRSSTSAASWAALRSKTSRASRCSSSNPSRPPSRRSSAYPITTASGVRSSCDTSPRRSSLARSRSRSLAFSRARSLATTAARSAEALRAVISLNATASLPISSSLPGGTTWERSPAPIRSTPCASRSTGEHDSPAQEHDGGESEQQAADDRRGQDRVDAPQARAREVVGARDSCAGAGLDAVVEDVVQVLSQHRETHEIPTKRRLEIEEVVPRAVIAASGALGGPLSKANA